MMGAALSTQTRDARSRSSLEGAGAASLGELSPREQEIALAAAQGLSDKQIAGELGVRISTVRTYWARIRRKLHAINRTHAVCLALEVPGVSPDDPTQDRAKRVGP